MKRIRPAFLLLSTASMLFAACITNGASNTSNDPAETDSIYPPVETKKPNTDYQTAIEGQTPAAGEKTKTPYESQVTTDKLQSPWGLAVLHASRLLNTENEGNMRIVSPTGELSEAIGG